jgi:SOS response regulatory protein OraA/RecX
MKDPTDSNTTHKRLLRSALFYLKYRFRTEFEMTSYLQRKVVHASIGEIQGVISELKSQNFVNDERFTHEWIAAQLRKGKGPYYVNKQLRKLRVDPIIINQALDNIDDKDQINAAKEIVYKKSHLFNKLNNIRKRLKIKQYLFNNGFSPQIIREVIDDLLIQGVE